MTEGANEIFLVKIQLANVGVHNFIGKLVRIDKKVTCYCLVQALFRYQESSHINRFFSHKFLWLQVL